jgi:hypothetical protein
LLAGGLLASSAGGLFFFHEAFAQSTERVRDCPEMLKVVCN